MVNNVLSSGSVCMIASMYVHSITRSSKCDRRHKGVYSQSWTLTLAQIVALLMMQCCEVDDDDDDAPRRRSRETSVS